MRGLLRRFIPSEDGAVTVDWVVLTAAVVGLCIGLVATLNDETSGLSQRANGYISSQEPGNVGTQTGEDGG
ncbi:MAG: Flp family type IVb pilin [Roseobacter sp.]